jgi:hypothetical protein
MKFNLSADNMICVAVKHGLFQDFRIQNSIPVNPRIPLVKVLQPSQGTKFCAITKDKHLLVKIG